MDLLNEKREQPEEKSKGKKIVLILLILSIIGAIGIGILISLIGAHCFVYLMIKKTYGFGGN